MLGGRLDVLLFWPSKHVYEPNTVVIVIRDHVTDNRSYYTVTAKGVYHFATHSYQERRPWKRQWLVNLTTKAHWYLHPWWVHLGNPSYHCKG